MKGISIAGRKKISEFDHYATPAWATEALLNKEKFSRTVWECACGDGAIVEVLKKYGHGVIATDIQNGEDFFEQRPSFLIDIVTNPPFNQAEKFVWHALEVGGNKVAMFLKLSFLESEGRKKLFEETPLETVYVFRKRVNLYPYGQEKPKNSGTTAYAWYVWNRNYKGAPKIKWL